MSSEFEELIALTAIASWCSPKGRIAGEFRPPIERVTESDLLNAAFVREEELDG